ncbi:MAG TPA: OmpH family outer membrane protein [Saprospiraceae bacterium]|nr:OmpH family outer membrane protein [Saprospiraceae bacterium]HMU04486.1 OmpH family outer membrane protein [Saprospiraceae bacterium]
MRSILNIVSIAAFTGLAFMACNKPATTEATPAASTTTETGADKIVFIDIDTLLSKYNLYLDKKSELEGQSKTAEKALAGKIEAFQKRLGKFQQDVVEIQQKANTIAPIELKKMEEKFGQQQQNLAKEEESLMKQRDNAAIELEGKLLETQKDLQKKIDDYLDKLAEEKGYDLVLMKGSTGSVMFGKASLDITEETVKRLNEEYEANKTKE